MNLKLLAKSVTILDGLVTLWMLPFSSLHSQLIVDSIRREFVDPDDWQPWQHYFQLFEAFVVDVDFNETDNAHVKGLHHYWSERNGSIAHNAELFPQAVSADIQPILLQAYLDTREKLPGVSKLLADGKPPKETDLEKKSTIVGGKR